MAPETCQPRLTKAQVVKQTVSIETACAEFNVILFRMSELPKFTRPLCAMVYLFEMRRPIFALRHRRDLSHVNILNSETRKICRTLKMPHHRVLRFDAAGYPTWVIDSLIVATQQALGIVEIQSSTREKLIEFESKPPEPKPNPMRVFGFEDERSGRHDRLGRSRGTLYQLLTTRHLYVEELRNAASRTEAIRAVSAELERLYPSRTYKVPTSETSVWRHLNDMGVYKLYKPLRGS